MASTPTTSTPTPKTASDQPEEGDWFFDMIIGFLRSPRWKTPVMSFIDEYCTVFDDEDENKLEFTKIHKDFKKIVEDLLGELMAELGVTDEQFLAACQKAEANPIHKKIVDQIMAVESFLAFKRLMVKRNQELNKQAIELFEKLQQKQQTPTPAAESTTATGMASTKPKEEEKKADATPAATDAGLSEDDKKKQAAELREVMKLAHDLERQEEEEMMKKALAESEKVTSEERKVIDEEEEMIKQAIAASEREEEERKKKVDQEGQLAGQLENVSSQEAEIVRQRTLLEEKERQLKALMEENKRQKETAEKALREKEEALNEREKQLNQRSELQPQELAAEKQKILAERQTAQEAAKAGGLATATIAATSAAAAQSTKASVPASVSSDPVSQAKAGPSTMTEAPKVTSTSVTAPAAQKQVSAMPAPASATVVNDPLAPKSVAKAQTVQAVSKDPLPPAATSELPSLGGGASLSGLPSLGSGMGRKPFGLGGVGSRAGAFDLDPEALKRANAELAKLNKIGDYDFEEEEKKEEAPDGRSMMQVMQDKRKATEAANAAAMASKPQPTGETMDERKARLAAQRDLLRKMKEEKRVKELNEFNAQLKDDAAPQKNLAEEFKQIDANKQLPSGSNPEMDRRRMIYKNIRKEISETEKADKQKAYAEKMSAMEIKMKQKDEDRKKQQQESAAQAAESEKLRKQATLQSKNFLENIEAFNVD